MRRRILHVAEWIIRLGLFRESNDFVGLTDSASLEKQTGPMRGAPVLGGEDGHVSGPPNRSRTHGQGVAAQRSKSDGRSRVLLLHPAQGTPVASTHGWRCLRAWPATLQPNARRTTDRLMHSLPSHLYTYTYIYIDIVTAAWSVR
jgi:hypothetical protein